MNIMQGEQEASESGQEVELEEVIEEDGSVIEEEVVEEEYEEVEYEEEVEEEVVEVEEGGAETEGTSENPIMVEEEVPVTTTDDDGAITDADNADTGDEIQEVGSQEADEEKGLLTKDAGSWGDLNEKFVADRKPSMSSCYYWLCCFLVLGLLGGLGYFGYYLTEDGLTDRSNPNFSSIRPTNPPTIATE